MKMTTVLTFALLAGMFTSCRGQIYPQTKGNHGNDNSIGDTVTALDKAIFIVFQDKKSNYWFGSDGQGVYRYDGKTLIHFSTKDGLPHNRIREIKEDNAGNIFFATLGGICKFDGRRLTTLPVTESNEWRLEVDDLWFVCNQEENGPYRYDGKVLYHLQFPKHYMEDEFYKRLPNPPFNPYQVYTIYKDSKENIWFGTSTFGLYRYDGKSLSCMYERHLTHIGEEGSFGIRSIIEDNKGKFWFCNTSYRYNIAPYDSTEKHLIKYKREKGIDVKAPNGDDKIYFMSIAEDDKGDLWMATYNLGVWRYNGKEMMRYPVKDGAKDVTLFAIYKDNKGDLWLGSHEAGAYKFNGETFEKFLSATVSK